MPAPPASSPIAQAFPIVRRALKILADREVSPQTGLLKSTLLQLDSTFSERNYGASSFLDFVEKLAQAGLVQLKHAGRSVMVELNNQFDEAEAASVRPKAVERWLATPVPNRPAWRRRCAGIRLRRAAPHDGAGAPADDRRWPPSPARSTASRAEATAEAGGSGRPRNRQRSTSRGRQNRPPTA